MKFRKFGNSEFRVSEIGFGCGGFWGLKRFPFYKAEELVKAGLEKGINVFDTGPNYSKGNAEKRLGEILNGKFDNVLVCTKVGTRYIKGRNIKDWSIKGIKESIYCSLKNLKTDQLPLLQLHSPSKKELNDEIFGLLEKLKTNGTVRYVGASCDDDVVNDAIESNRFDSLMVTFNVLHRKAIGDLIKKGHEKGIAIMIRSPMAHTLYSDEIFRIKQLSDVWYLLRSLKNFKKDIIMGKRFRVIERFDDWSSHEIALKYVLENRYISTAIVGTVKKAHLVANLNVVDRERLPEEILKVIGRLQEA